MDKFKVVSPASFYTGKIQLNEKQSSGRMHCLSKVNDDIFEITSTIQFKVGEVVGREKLSKAEMMFLEPVVEVEEEKKPARKAK